MPNNPAKHGNRPRSKIRQEIDPGGLGRLIDAINAIVRGALAGSGVAVGLAICAGSYFEAVMATGSIPDALNASTRTLLTTTVLGLIVWTLTASLSTYYYAHRIGAYIDQSPSVARRDTASTSAPVTVPAEGVPIADYQGYKGLGKINGVGAPFTALKALGIVLICAASLMAIAGISFLVGGDGTESALIAFAIGAGGIAIGIALIMLVRRLREQLKSLFQHDPRGRRSSRPAGLSPAPAPGAAAFGALGTLRAILSKAALVLLVGAVLVFAAWASVSGQAVVSGGRLHPLPNAEDLSPSQLSRASTIMAALAIAAAVAALVWIICHLIVIAQYLIARAALSRAAQSGQAGTLMPEKRMTLMVLSDHSPSRKLTELGAAFALVLFVMAANLPARAEGAAHVSVASALPSLSGSTPALAIAMTIAALLCLLPAVFDFAYEQRRRAMRNNFFATWPWLYAAHDRGLEQARNNARRHNR